VGGLIDLANLRATHSRDAGLFSVDCVLDLLDRRRRIGGLCGVGSISILLRAENGSHVPSRLVPHLVVLVRRRVLGVRRARGGVGAVAWRVGIKQQVVRASAGKWRLVEANPITIQMIGKVGHAYRQAAISVH
jgi:hypothetical protein